MNNKVYTKKPNYTQLASVLMGKDLYFQWRGQCDFAIIVDYTEWLKFVETNINLLQNRTALNYKRLLLTTTSIETKYRYFYYDVAWAQYIEVLLSSSRNKEASMILPYNANCNEITIETIHYNFSRIPDKNKQTALNSFKSVTTAYSQLKSQSNIRYLTIEYESLSDWNKALLDVVIYLHVRSLGELDNDNLNIVKG